MDIRHPKAILIVGPPACNALGVIKDLTGSAPSRTDPHSIAGLTHQWAVQTRYYSATIPIWVDEIADVEQWKAEFLKPEAKEVVEAVGAWLVCFSADQLQADSKVTESILQAVQDIVGEHAGYSDDSIMLAVANSTVGTPMNDDKRGLWEDKTMEHGFELIDYANNGHNEYGEKQGIARVKEALTTHEWSIATKGDNDNDDLDEQVGELPLDQVTLEADLDLRAALMSDHDASVLEPGPDDNGEADAGDQSAVDDLDVMLGKLLAARERVADLPEEQRKKAAANAVRQLMSNEF